MEEEVGRDDRDMPVMNLGRSRWMVASVSSLRTLMPVNVAPGKSWS